MKRKYVFIIFFSITLVLLAVVSWYVYIIVYSPQIERHSYGDYEVFEIRGLLSHRECDELIAECERRPMAQSKVLSQEKGDKEELSDTRKSHTVWLGDNEHKCAMKMADYSEYITNYPKSHQEKLQVVKYDEGGKFDPHYDAQYDTSTQTRVATLLLYLNDDYEGGETTFTELGLSIRPERGKAILFRGLDNDNKIISKSKHCGEEVRKGNKWICTKWTHINPYKEGPKHNVY